ncbi:hypothetical protein B296_00021214 [Ensete ventricosum]|uniref:Uncharacterized protein n=1 Tax=Ensete ventricosum TaxID=4639 RepID=A0A426ZJS7_ENSVE|nr:hypothetical protein B296_00021214 [Ensete ventricosum]
MNRSQRCDLACIDYPQRADSPATKGGGGCPSQPVLVTPGIRHLFLGNVAVDPQPWTNQICLFASLQLVRSSAGSLGLSLPPKCRIQLDLDAHSSLRGATLGWRGAARNRNAFPSDIIVATVGLRLTAARRWIPLHYPSKLSVHSKSGPADHCRIDKLTSRAEWGQPPSWQYMPNKNPLDCR